MAKRFFIIIGVTLFSLLSAVGIAKAELFMSISGIIIDSSEKVGLSNVKIVLMSPAKEKVSEALSNKAGRFIIRDVPEGSYYLITHSEDSFHVNLSEAIPITVRSGKNVVGIAISLLKGGAFRGRIITSQKHTVPHASIVSDSGAFAITDAEGNFLLKGVPDGAININIIPSAIGSKIISTISKAGEIVDLGDIPLSVGVETAIKGAVMDNKGSPISDAFIIAYKDSLPVGYTISAHNGSFVLLGLDNSLYDVSVIADVYNLEKLQTSVPNSNMRVILESASNITATSADYQKVNKGIESVNLLSHILELFSPREAFAAQCSRGACSSGLWGGVFADVYGNLRPVGASVVISNNWCFGAAQKNTLENNVLQCRCKFPS